MKLPTRGTKKKTGRPATGQIPAITARLPRAVVDRVEEWAAKNGATRSQAIRRLVEIGLQAKKWLGDGLSIYWPVWLTFKSRGRLLDVDWLRHRLRIMSNKVIPFEWATAKLAEREAFNRISAARTQTEWFSAWRIWAATVRNLHQQAKRPEPTSTPEFV
jgi:hypothetical protein